MGAKRSAVPELGKFLFSSLLCESIRYIEMNPLIRSKMLLLTIS